MANKTAKNLLSGRTEYNRYYGNFRGVDFSSDHTQVHEQRLAYAVNMYKDYGSEQGKALETIPGFRRRMAIPGGRVHAIHTLKKREEGEERTYVLVHAGSELYLWSVFPESADVEEIASATVPAPHTSIGALKEFHIPIGEIASRFVKAETAYGEDISINCSLFEGDKVKAVTSVISEGDTVYIHYIKHETGTEQLLFSGMNEEKSVSFTMLGKLYILDGKNYLCFDGESVTSVTESAFVPTTYINIVPGGENMDAGTEYMQRNLLSPYFKHTYIAEYGVQEYFLNEAELEEITEVKVYGSVYTQGEDYTVDLESGAVRFKIVPPPPQEVEMGKDEEGNSIRYPEGYAGIEITAKKTLKSIRGVKGEIPLYEIISSCRYASVYDGRVFLAGSESAPDHIFYCERNDTGYPDPTYFGALNYVQDGLGDVPIRALLPVADTLMALKEEGSSEGTVYYHRSKETGNGVQPKIYPSESGLHGVGCRGEAASFFDDPVFISARGVDAVGQLSVRYERAIEHRSSMIDTKLFPYLADDIRLAVWQGYLVMLTGGGRIFLADSRQTFTDEQGGAQYEWYYLESIGVWSGQYVRYDYAAEVPIGLADKKVSFCKTCKRGRRECTCSSGSFIELPLEAAADVYDYELDTVNDLRGTVANTPGSEREIFTEIMDFTHEEYAYPISVPYTVHAVRDRISGEALGYRAFLCEDREALIGGEFHPATALCVIDGVLYFGTENGVVCCFNTDKRDEGGEIPTKWYTFDGRAIFSGCATLMDNCGIPHLTKSTVKKSTVIKTKTFATSAAKVKVRTNKKAYENVGRINSTVFSFDGMDFADFSFIVTEQSLFAVKEKEKKWVEKQYLIFSDEYQKPFALYYVAYRYVVAGRYK